MFLCALIPKQIEYQIIKIEQSVAESTNMDVDNSNDANPIKDEGVLMIAYISPLQQNIDAFDITKNVQSVRRLLEDALARKMQSQKEAAKAA